jgi:hypothetical protein
MGESRSGNCQPFMEDEGSSLCSLVPAILSSPEGDEFSSNSTCLKFILIFLFHVRLSQRVSSNQKPRTGITFLNPLVSIQREVSLHSPSSGRTAHCPLSETVHSIHSQLCSISGVRPLHLSAEDALRRVDSGPNRTSSCFVS